MNPNPSDPMQPLSRTGTAVLALLAALLVLPLAFAPRADGFIYWADSWGTIYRAELDGTAVGEVVSDTGGGAFAVDARHIYWTTFGGTIGRANLDGTGADNSFITGANNAGGVAVNARHVYWANIGNTDTSTDTGTIGRAKLDGTGVDQSFIAGVGGNFLRDVAV